MQAHDEVCGMTILVEEAVASVDFQGQTYYFCTHRCSRKFEEHPDWYVTVEPEAPAHEPVEHAAGGGGQSCH